jgi:hypothetical protein
MSMKNHISPRMSMKNHISPRMSMKTHIGARMSMKKSYIFLNPQPQITKVNKKVKFGQINNIYYPYQYKLLHYLYV